MGYKIITKMSTMSCDRFSMPDDELYMSQLCTEQQEAEKRHGISFDDVLRVRFLDGYETETDIETAKQMLSVKEGFDLVLWSSGNVGYVAYYGSCITGFEVIREV